MPPLIDDAEDQFEATRPALNPHPLPQLRHAHQGTPDVPEQYQATDAEGNPFPIRLF